VVGPARVDLAERLDGVRASIDDLESRVRATELATGDEKTATELRRAVEALAKRDPKLETKLTDRVDVLADRLATIGATVSTTAASLARKDGEIATLRRDLESRDKRLDDLLHRLESNTGTEEIEKLRTAIRAVQAERPARGVGDQVNDLSRKLAFLAERIDTLATTVATTAAGLAGREGEIAVLRQRLDRDSARIDQATAELGRIHDDGSLARRLDALENALDARTVALSARETEVSALRTRIDESEARVESVAAELQTSIATLAAGVRAFETFPGATERALESLASSVDSRMDELAARVARLAAQVEAAVTTIEDGGSEVATLEGRVGAVSIRVDGLAAELEQVVGRLPAQWEKLVTHSNALGRSLASMGDRVATIERDRTETATQLERAGAAWSEERARVRARLDSLAAAHKQVAQTNDGLVPAVGELTARLGAMESGQVGASAEIARLSAELDSERRLLHEQLDGLAAALAEAGATGTDEESEQRLGALGSRLDSVERHGAAVASELTRLREASDAERATLHAEVEELAAAIAESKARAEDAETDRKLGELSTRLRAVEADGAAAAAELARSATATASELRTIEKRLEDIAASSEGGTSDAQAETARWIIELAGRLDDMRAERQAWQAERSTLERRLDEVAARVREVSSEAHVWSDEEIALLRSSIDGLRLRLAASEQQLMTLEGSRDAGERLDEVARRVQALEQAPLVVGPSADGGTRPDDGRFRLELRALELRMEHAEAAARENREAVLVQLERLATAIEWRFQRLEAETTEREQQAVGGEVVPIRPEV
jgi:chromosome segregation ATPase